MPSNTARSLSAVPGHDHQKAAALVADHCLFFLDLITYGKSAVRYCQIISGQRILKALKGKSLNRSSCAGISILGRITSGVKLINLDEGVTVASLAKVREKVEENANGGSSEEPVEEADEKEN